MVAQNNHTKRPEVRDAPEDRSYDLFIEFLNGPNLSFYIALVSHFVRRLDVDENKIEFLQGLDGLLTLSEIVGVRISRGTFDRKNLQPRVNADAVKKIHGRYHAAPQLVLIRNPLHLGRPSLPPEPYAIRRLQGLPRSFPIGRISGEKFLRKTHQTHDPLGPWPFRKIRTTGLAGDVMGRRGGQFA